ncbi:MAG: flippase-like domain-containing protein [Firmicutes bacterium]|nr:flippase-like domain-containing protein [Bacillota bacterium]
MKKLRLILLFLLLAVLFWQFDLNSFLDSLRQVPLVAFLALLVLQVISQLLVNYQWCSIGKLMGGAHNFLQMLYVNARGAIIESITPGVKVGGEITRAILLKKELHYSAQEAATLVTLQKMVSFSSFFCLNLFAFAHLANKIEFFQAWAAKVAFSVFCLSLMSLIFSLFFLTNLWEKKISEKSFKNRWLLILQDYLLTLIAKLKLLKRNKGELRKQFLLSFAIWLLFPLKMIFLVHFFTPHYDPLLLAEITFLSYMVGMIPLFPGGLGSFEATMASLLRLLQVPASASLAITLLFRFLTFWFVLLLSLLYAVLWKRGEMGKWNRQKS